MARVAPISLQQSFWNRWNASHRENSVDEIPRRQAEIVCGWLNSLGRTDLEIIDVGCGAGWLCRQLLRFGRLTGTDLSDEVLARAQERTPEARLIAGDFMKLDFGPGAFDVIVTLEVLSHVADPRAFLKKLASHLRAGGHLMLATQNRFVLQHLNFIPPPAPGQLRRWVDRRELRDLLAPDFEVLELFAVTPRVGHGLGIRQWLGAKGLRWPGPAGAEERGGTLPTARQADPVRARRRLAQSLEALGLGWTLMALARKRMSP